MTQINSAFARRLRRRMAQLGLTQMALAEKSGVTQGNISHVLTGRIKMLEAPAMFRLADALEVDARWLTTGERTE